MARGVVARAGVSAGAGSSGAAAGSDIEGLGGAAARAMMGGTSPGIVAFATLPSTANPRSRPL